MRLDVGGAGIGSRCIGRRGPQAARNGADPAAPSVRVDRNDDEVGAGFCTNGDARKHEDVRGGRPPVRRDGDAPSRPSARRLRDRRGAQKPRKPRAAWAGTGARLNDGTRWRRAQKARNPRAAWADTINVAAFADTCARPGDGRRRRRPRRLAGDQLRRKLTAGQNDRKPGGEAQRYMANWVPVHLGVSSLRIPRICLEGSITSAGHLTSRTPDLVFTGD